MTRTWRRIPAVVALAVAMLVAATLAGADAADAQDAAPLDVVFPGFRALGSHDWNVKANAVVQWKAMTERFKQQQAECQPSDGCAKFKELVDRLKGLVTLDQVKTAQSAADALPYKEDIVNYKKADYWATPYEMLSIGGGDTEDFAILKYYALRAAGMPAAAMRVMAVRIKSLGGIGHAILVVDTTPEPFVLDNRVAPIMTASMVGKEFLPELGINEDGWWVYIKKTQ